jgi:hypothetical protein
MDANRDKSGENMYSTGVTGEGERSSKDSFTPNQSYNKQDPSLSLLLEKGTLTVCG